MTRHVPRSSNESGFALVELLVALSILAMMLAMVPSTLRLGKRAWDTPGDPRNSPETAALIFAAQSLKGALPVYERDSTGLGSRIMFTGDASQLSYVTELAAGPHGGGLYRIDIDDKGGGARKLRISLFRESQTPQVSSDERMLERSYRSLRFRYFGPSAPGAAAHWQDVWPRHDVLPDLVEITATPADATANGFAAKIELNMRPTL